MKKFITFFAILTLLSMPLAVFAQQVEEETQEAVQETEEAAQEAAQETEQAAQEVEQETEEAVQETEQETEELAQETEQEAQEVEQETEQAVQETEQETEELAQETEQEMEQQERSGLSGSLYRVSNLNGMTVTDQQNAEVGEIQDIILSSDGQISHVLANLDEYEGLESGRYLIPADAISIQNQNIQVQQLQQEAMQVQDDQMLQQQIGQNSIRATQLMDYAVVGSQNEDVGGIEDIVVDVQQGQVAYVALSSGGFLGIGDTMIAVPFSDVQYDMTQEQVSINVSQQEIENIEGFNQDSWPQEANENWKQGSQQQEQ